MIGIIGAMEIEVNALKGRLSNARKEKISGIEFVLGTLYEKEVVVAACGVGKVFAAVAAEAMILKYNPEIIVNSGVAGALSKELGIADIVVATDVVQHDMNTTPLGDPPGFLSGINKVFIPCSKKASMLLCKASQALGISPLEGRIASGDLFVSTIKQKRNVAEKFSAVACEMEGASIGHVCYVNNVDFAVIRSISDSLSDDSHMEYPEFLKIAAENSIKIMDKFIALY